MGKFVDQTGKTFGILKILSEAGRTKHGVVTWSALCECGNTKEVSSNALQQGLVKSCGCRMGGTPLDLTGRRFGKLLALSQTGETKRAGRIWHCACDCGGSKNAIAAVLVHGLVISCGCAVRDKTVYWSPEVRASQAVLNARRRALKRACGGAFTIAEIGELYTKQRGCCGNCKKPLKGVFHRDHRTPLARGGRNDISNIELLCPRCNTKKRASDPVDWAQANGRLL